MQKNDDDTALLIVDPQNDFCPGGTLAVATGDQIIPIINALRPHFNTIVISQDCHPHNHISFSQDLWPVHCVQGTHGAEFHAKLLISPKDLIIQKGTRQNIDSYSAFFENDHKTSPTFSDGQTLTQKLHSLKISKLVIVGLAFDYCVGWTALDAVHEGFDVTIIKNATRGIASDSMATMQKQLEDAGVKIRESIQF